MMTRIALAFVSALLLAGCTDADWQHATSFVGFSDAKPAAARPTPVRAATAGPARRLPAAPANLQAPSQPAPPDPFCQAVATQDSGRNDFDPATQRSVYLQSYQQCASMFGGATPR